MNLNRVREISGKKKTNVNCFHLLFIVPKMQFKLSKLNFYFNVTDCGRKFKCRLQIARFVKKYQTQNKFGLRF